MRVNEAAHRRLQVAPGDEQSQRVGCFQTGARQVQPATVQRRDRHGGFVQAVGSDGSGDASGFVAGAQFEGQARRIAIAREVERKVGDLAGKDRFAAPGCDDESVQVAKGMHHAGEGEADQQEDEGVAQCQVVIDRAGEHRQQGCGKKEAGARRQDEDAALREAQWRGPVAPPAKEPALKVGDDAHGFREWVPCGSAR